MPAGYQNSPKGAQMTKLTRPFTEQGQSPWLDNLSRAHLGKETLGISGVSGMLGLLRPARVLGALEAKTGQPA